MNNKPQCNRSMRFMLREGSTVRSIISLFYCVTFFAMESVLLYYLATSAMSPLNVLVALLIGVNFDQLYRTFLVFPAEMIAGDTISKNSEGGQ